MYTDTLRRVVVLGVITLMPLIPVQAQAVAIEISTIEALQRIGHDPAYPLNGYYVLTQDIDASPTALWDHGAGFSPIGGREKEEDYSLCFTGWFDGRGHVIRDLVINRPDANMVGLFGSLGAQAVVVNLGLEGGAVTGGDYVGALAGENWSAGVAGCYANVAVAGISRVGGLIGINRGVIEMAYAVGSAAGERYVGGLVGRNYKGLIEECYAAAPVWGLHLAGGLTGETVEGDVVACFWDIEASGAAVSGGGTGLTTAEMTAPGAFIQAAWDLRNNWGLVTGRGYPYLR